MLRLTTIITLCCVLLTGCLSRQPEPVVDVVEPAPIFQSYSATFQGVLHPSPDADYQLITDIGKIIYISTSSDLTKYLKQTVEVSGKVTGEENSILGFSLERISALQKVILDDADKNLDNTDEETADEIDTSEKEDNEDLIEVNDTDSESDTNLDGEQSSSSLSVSSSSSVAIAEDFIEDVPKSKEEAIAAMASENLSADQWTFTYCTHHFEGFCVPIHKNWWYKAFGATSESLFHIEIGVQELLELGDGIISIDLVKQGEDDGFDSQFPRVSWGGNDFVFVVSGPLTLQTLMQQIADSITSSV